MTALTTKSFHIQCGKHQAISDIKKELEVMEDWPVAEQCLSHKGTVLEDGRRLSEYNIVAGDTLHLWEHPRRPAGSTVPQASTANHPQALSADRPQADVRGNTAGSDRGGSLADRVRRVMAATRSRTATGNVFVWGKMKGKTFEDVFNESPTYVQWCASHLVANPTPTQKAWLAYIEKKVQALEVEHGFDPLPTLGGGLGPQLEA